MTQADRYRGRIVFAALLACGLAAVGDERAGRTQIAQAGGPVKPASAPPAASAPPQQVRAPSRSQRGELFYARRFGVDQMQVHYIASGASLEFRYRVVDAEKAKILTDKRNTPRLIDVATGTVLSVPTGEKIGERRQTPPPEAGREYWIVFSNPGKRVKPGGRVNVAIGSFHADGLVVE